MGKGKKKEKDFSEIRQYRCWKKYGELFLPFFEDRWIRLIMLQVYEVFLRTNIPLLTRSLLKNSLCCKQK